MSEIKKRYSVYENRFFITFFNNLIYFLFRNRQ
jgi:hypothetical protein